MNNSNPIVMFAAVAVSWAGTVGAFVASHISTGIGVLCGIASLVATYYAIQVSRTELKLKRKQLDDYERKSPGSGMVPTFAALLVIAFLAVGCASNDAGAEKPQSAPNRFDRTLYDIETNYTRVVVGKTNTVLATNVESAIVEGHLVWTTNVVVETRVALVTNLVPSYDFHDRPAIKSGTQIGGTIAGNLLGIGGWLGAALAGAYSTYGQLRSRKVNKAFVTAIETGREILKETPEGQALDRKYVQWLQEHQAQAGVIKTVGKLVDTFVDNEAARSAASLIVRDVPATATTSKE